MGFFSNFFDDFKPSTVATWHQEKLDGIDPINSYIWGLDAGATKEVAKNPILSGAVQGIAGYFGGPWGAALASSSLARERGAGWGRALGAGATSYATSSLGESLNSGGEGATVDYGDGSAFPAGDGSAYSGAGSAAGGSAGGASTAGSNSSVEGMDTNWDFEQYSPEIAGSADAGFSNFMNDFALADLGGGKEKVFGDLGSVGFDQNILEGTTGMYDDFYTDPSAWEGYSDSISPDFSGVSGYNPDDWAGFSDEIAANPTDYFTSGTLRDMYTRGAKDFLGASKPYLKVARGLNDLYAKNRMSRDLRNRENEINAYRNELDQRLNNYYAPGSAEANLLRQKMERQDARAGRNSQYGVREANLAGTMAQNRANYASAMAPTLANIMNQQSQLRTAGSALKRGQLAGMWQTGGALRDLF